jgi:hypothetical protein
MTADLATNPEARPDRPRWRVGLPSSMALIVVLALGLAMMKAATEWIARSVVLAAFVVLLVATVGAIVRRRDRAAWIGFAAFGWAHLIVALIASSADLIFSNSDEDEPGLWRVDGLAGALASRLHPELPQPVRTPQERGHSSDRAELKFLADFEANTALYEARHRAAEHSRAIGVAFQGLAFALVGAATGRALSDRYTLANASQEASTSTLPG